MKSFLKSPVVLALALAGSAAAPTGAATLTEFIGGVSSSGNFVGQSFTIAGSGSFTNISFNFFTTSASSAVGNPAAAGTGFILSTAYTGTPAALSSATPGYLGSATASGGFYNFGNTVTLLGGAKYFFYSNTAFNHTSSGLDGYSGGNQFITPFASSVVLTTMLGMQTSE